MSKMLKRSREDDNDGNAGGENTKDTMKEKLLLFTVDVYGDTSMYFSYAADKSRFTEEQIKKLFRSVPSDREKDGLDYYNMEGELQEGWECVEEQDLAQFTSDYHCTVVMCYSNE